MVRTKLQQLTYVTPKGSFTVRKDDLAHAQKVFGDPTTPIGWKQCHTTPNGVDFFLDLCELMGMDFIPETISDTGSDSRKLYFDLCDFIQVTELPEIEVVSTEIIPDPVVVEQEFMNEPVTKEVATAVEAVVIEEPEDTIEALTGEPEESAMTPLEELIKMAEEMDIIEEPVITEDIHSTEDAENNIIKEESTMDNNTIFTEQLKGIEDLKDASEVIDFDQAADQKEDSTMGESAERIQDATAEATDTMRNAMGVINKCISSFKLEAKKIGQMEDRQVYDYVMGRLNGHIEWLYGWTAEKYHIMADALAVQRDKIRKANKKVEETVEEAEDLDGETKVGVLGNIKAVLGRVIKTTIIVVKNVAKYAIKLAGIVLTLGYRIGRDIVVETYCAGKAVVVATTDTVAEIKAELGIDPATSDDDYSEDEFVDEDVTSEYAE